MAKKKVHYVSAACGAGKTHSFCNYMKSTRDFNVLYAAPSVDLVNETRRRLKEAGVYSDIITSETHPGEVKKAIMSYLDQAGQADHLLIVCQKALFELPYFPKRSDWMVVFDEIPQVDRPHSFDLPRNSQHLLKHLRVQPWTSDDVFVLVAENDGRLRKLLEGPKDSVDQQFRGLFEDLACPNRTTFISKENWETLSRGEAYGRKEEKKNRICCLSMLNCSPFENSVILGANADHWLLRKWLERTYGVVFEPHEELTAGLLTTPEVGCRLRLRYFIPGRRYSKYLGDLKADKGGPRLIDRMDELARDELGGGPFLVFCNNDRKKLSERKLGPKAEFASTYCFGLNAYRHHTQTYFSAALNPEPQHFKLLNLLGLSSEDVHQSIAYESTYQAIMRTSLRDPQSDAMVTAIVPDQPTAEAIAKITGCRDVSQLGNLFAAKLPALTPAQRRNRKEYKGVMKLLSERETIRNSLTNENRNIPCQSDLGECPNPIFMTLYKAKKEVRPECFCEVSGSIQDCVAVLAKWSRAEISQKESRFLFVPGVFERPEGGAGFRRNAYLKQLSALALDFDGGTMSPEAFLELFGEKAKLLKLSFVLMNSYSRTSEQPNKFRVIIFYSRPITGPPEDIYRIHGNVFDWFEDLLDGAGYPPDVSGLDRASRVPNQPYHAPCTNREHSKSWLFGRANLREHELETYALDPMIFDYPDEELQTCGQPEFRLPFAGSNRSKAIVERVLANLKAMHANRRIPIRNAAITLVRQGGLSHEEVNSALMVVAGNQKHLKRHVTEAIKFLRKAKITPPI